MRRARSILLNTSFAGPQIREVAEREGTDLLVYDDEYAELLEGVEPPHGRWRAWTERGSGDDTLEALIERGDRRRAPPKAGRDAEDHDPHQRHDRHARRARRVASRDRWR